MKFLQIGLGSMGKRRIRCLKSLGYKDMLGFDLREDRRREVEEKYGIKTIACLDEVDFKAIDFIIVSTPPDYHTPYIDLAIKKGKPVFVEASVLLSILEQLNKKARKRGVPIYPSCTMKFHPSIKEITEVVRGKKYGKVTNFSYHIGQYLPDWHPFENVKDFYVSKKETSAAREMVPFEMTWIVDVAGFPKKIVGFVGKTMDVGCDIEDTYAIAMKFPNDIYGTATVDVCARYATRTLLLNMEYGQILWRWDDNIVKIYEANTKRWINIHPPEAQGAAEGYNKNIIEQMYIDELDSAIKASLNKGEFPNTLDNDIAILKLLLKVEEFNAKQ